jgi:adenosine deaminase
MNNQINLENYGQIEEIIKKIPKNDLHVHLDGSVRLETIIELSKKEGLDLPSYTVEGMNELVFKDQYANLGEYLKTFGYSGAVMQKPEHLEQISYELALDNQKEGVRYIEVRFAPQLHINETMDLETVLKAVNAGLEKAEKGFNRRPEIKNNQEPPFHYSIIVCAMRDFGPWSVYFKNFIDSFTYSSRNDICKMASLELAKGAVKIRDKVGLPIMAFDLAGAEAGNPAADHWRAFQYVHEAFMHKTVHAGEDYGPESIFQAITELHADRIGHGYSLFDASRIASKDIADKNAYISDITQYIADRRITIEICLTSNMQTNPSLKKIEDHTFSKMLDHHLSTTFCTDNRTVSKTNITREILLALNHFQIDKKALRNCIIYGFKRSFFPGRYSQKRNYVRRCLDYYDKTTANFPVLHVD